MTPSEAAEIMFPGLGLRNIDAGMIAEIKDAFRIFAKAVHPDTAAAENEPTYGKYSLDQYKQARDTLLDHVNGVKPACPVCGGKGTVKGNKFKPQPCPKGCKAGAHGQAITRRKGQARRGFRH